MGYDLLAGLFFAALLPSVLLGFAAYWRMTNRARTVVEGAFRAYATSRGLAFVEPAGEWPNRTNPACEWSSGGARFRLETVGKESRVRTRLTARPESSLLGRLSVAPRATVGDGPPPLAFDDVAFLSVFRVLESPPGFARRVLDDCVRRSLAGFRQGDTVTLGYRRARLVLEWPGAELNDARLDEARRVAELVAQAVDETFSAHRAA